MGYAGIIRSFGVSLVLLGLACFIPFFVALAAGEAGAYDYLFASVLAFLTGAACVGGAGEARAIDDFRGAIMMILLWWLATPFFAAVPFFLAGASFLDAYFEATSALTTTGAWLSQEAAIASPSGIVWRAILQWLGGLASLAIAAAIFIRPAFIGVDTLLPPFSRGDTDSYLKAIENAVAAFVSVYILMTAAAVLALSGAGASLFDAIIMAMSLVASGGFAPHAEGVMGYPFAVIGVMLPFLILSGANFVLIARFMRGKVSARNRDVETGVYLAAIMIVGVLYWLANGGGAAVLIPAQIFNAASLFSTYGVTIGEAPTLPFALVTVIIGGAAVSTAGGFKILRWLVIFRRAREEVQRLITPHGVFHRANVVDEFAVWIHFLAFTMTLAAFTLALTLAGHSFELSASAATAILANAGPVLALAGESAGAADYEIFGAPIRFLLCIGMILGRLEAVVALALINAAFWRS